MACVIPQPGATLARYEQAPYVAVLSGEMPPPLDQVARHAWIVVHRPGAENRRFEYGASGGSDPFDDFTGGDVMLHGVVTGSATDLAYVSPRTGRAVSAI